MLTSKQPIAALQLILDLVEYLHEEEGMHDDMQDDISVFSTHVE